MSSGFGLKGNVSRCFGYFEDFAQCMKDQSDGGNQLQCKPLRNDYLECLHHKKEVARVQAIATEAARQANPDSHGGGH